MSQPPSNPPSPGFPFSPQEAIEFMQKMWNPFGMQMPGFGAPGATPAAAAGGGFGTAMGGMPFPNPAALFATLDPAEIQRKIDELRIVEGWLQMSLNLMQMSVKTMELQKASLEALRGTPPPAPKPEHARRKT